MTYPQFVYLDRWQHCVNLFLLVTYSDDETTPCSTTHWGLWPHTNNPVCFSLPWLILCLN